MTAEPAILAGGAPGHVARALTLRDVPDISPHGSRARLQLVTNRMLGALTVAAAELPAWCTPGRCGILSPKDALTFELVVTSLWRHASNPSATPACN
jgi:hypothetical protein